MVSQSEFSLKDYVPPFQTDTPWLTEGVNSGSGGSKDGGLCQDHLWELQSGPICHAVVQSLSRGL